MDQSDIVQNKNSDDINNKSNFDIDNKTNTNIDNQTNLIKNLSYLSKDNLGNEYIIESKYSELNLDNVDIISMKGVSAKIIMVNSKPIYVTSNFAKYNNENYETTFTDNVLIVYLDNKIRCERFYISIENNLANVTDNVIYENPKGKLIADTIEIDLITKSSKIFMIDENKKVMVLNK
ncbi:MAG: LPS export ABC transporter periplasmic protein LptC [Pelagibacterales bacterium]|nr:LPS export ABC transporter periplasmic protein LptC [Pelagibacterales bacterium]